MSTPDIEALILRPATEIARLIQAQQVSPVEVTQAYIERAERLARLNAYISLEAEQALAAAHEAEAAIASGRSLSPLHGLPIAIKDQMDVAGMRTTLGGNIVDYVAQTDATVVARLRAAGAVILGKLNLSEYALGGNITHTYGVPHNPWDETRQAGQSSSGSGVAVAASLAAATLGGDTAGSIRGPAAWCGIVGLRPTWGRVSRAGAFPMAWFMDTIGPMTKTVADTALIFEAIAGPDPADPYTAKVPVTPFAQRPSLNGLRVGLVRESIDDGMASPDIAANTHAALKVLAEAGAEVGDAHLPLFASGGLIANTLADVEAAVVHRRWLRERPADYDFATRRRLLASSLVSGELYVKLNRFRTLVRRQVMDELARFDVLVTPTQADPAPPIATGTGFTSKEAVIKQFFGLRAHRSSFNLAGVPAMSVPTGFTAGGLPTSLQVVGRPFEEHVVMGLGHAYQQRTDWHEARPRLD